MTESTPENRVVVQNIATLVHGRYLLSMSDSEADPEAPEALLLGFHGFGELADKSMEALRELSKQRHWLLAAVQGLHPFYRRNGEIVASWMTSQDRELAIEDNIAYVSRVLAQLRGQYPSIKRVGCVGFSQGVAMAYRAVTRCGVPMQALLSMAGDVPPELRSGSHSLPPVLLARGSRDSWYSMNKVEQDLATLRAQGVTVETCLFDGGHEWTEIIYSTGREFLRRYLDQ